MSARRVEVSGAPLDGPRHEIARGAAGYPSRLEELLDPPERLYVIGEPDALELPTLAIIGARRATPYGLACARLAARCAADLGLAVASGAAVGCDQAGQREALARGARVVAVLGGGADVVYPRSAADMLAGIVARGGAVVSLQGWGAPPTRWSFVRRNAVISGLARALVICEAGLPSGTFSTAEVADQAGREVLVFPGSFFSPNSRGSNFLLSQSGFLPLWDREALEESLCVIYGRLRHPPASPGMPAGLPNAGGDNPGNPERPAGARATPWRGEPGLTRRERDALAALEACPARPEALARALGVDVVGAMRVLGGLDARGLVSRLVDGRYSASEGALLGREAPGAQERGAT